MGRAEFADEAAPAAAIDAQCRALKEQLGAFGYQCLCASAIYPRLRFSLSTYLVEVVAETVGRPKAGEEELLALFRLPWFRRGSMPVELRVRLIADLDKRVRKAARAAIRVTLYTALADRAEVPASGAVPLGRPPWRWRAMLNAYIDGAPAGAIERDPVFARFMKRRRLTMGAVARDRTLSRLLGRWAANLNGPRPLAALLLGSASIAAAVTADMWLKPMLEWTETRTTQVAVATPVPSPRTVPVPAPVPRPTDSPDGDTRPIRPTGLEPELDCLAKLVHYESAGEPRAGQLTVAEVILNRVRSGRFASTICGVVTQPGQFRGFDPATYDPPRDARWETAVAVARDAMQGSVRRPPYFFARRVPPPTPPPQGGGCFPGPYMVFFDSDSDQISGGAAAAILDNVAQAYGACGNASVRIAGFTDRAGSAEYNVGLSQRMANSIRAHLARRGIPDANISTEAFGESRPLVPTADGVREPQNRRVEILFRPAPPTGTTPAQR